MSRRAHINAILFSIVMILSMVAFATAGAGAIGSSADESVQTYDQFVDADGALLQPGTTLDAGQADIDGDLLAAAEDGPVTAIVRVVRADRALLSSGDRDAVVSELQAHAEATQAPVVELAAEYDDIEVVNQLWLTNAVVVEADADGLERLAGVRAVDRIHPNHEYTIPEVESTPDIDVSPDQDVTYGLDQLNAPDVWDQFNNKGEGASVAVLDTGYDNDHQDLPEIHPDDNWQEFDSGGNPVPSDPYESMPSVSHGTHVSGTIVGSDDPVGPVPAFGVAPEAELYHGLVIPGGGGTFAQVAAGMEWSVDEFETDIVSMSLGGGASNTDLIEASEHIWDAGMILVASNGNWELGAPGTYWSSFGSQAVDENLDPAAFAVYDYIEPDTFFPGDVPGHWPEEYLTPHASAAGVSVLSAVVGDDYDHLSGTSMSAPHHAGMFALMVSQNQGEPELEEFRTIAMETAERPTDDPIYGQGVSDALAAVEEVGPAIPEYGLGDVMETGEVTIDDAVKVQEYLAGTLDPEATFNENLADMDRDGDITIDDAVKVQEKLAGLLDLGEIEVTDLDAPAEVQGGETVEVTANLTNVGEEGALEIIEAHIAEDFENPLASAEMGVDMAIEGVEDPVQLPHEVQVTLTLGTEAIPGGDYSIGIFSDDHEATADITVLQPFFEITEFDAPDEVDQSELLTVDATVENTGNQNDTQTVEYVFDEVIEDSETVTLQPGEEQQFTFEFDPADVPGDTYEHGVLTDNDAVVANITVLEPFFEVVDIVGPDEVQHGDDITVSALIENVGDASDEQEITYSLGEAGQPGPVAIVTPIDISREHGDRFVNFFEDTLGEQDPGWTFTHVPPEDLLDEMASYETFVINRFQDEGIDGDDLASDFLSNLADDQGVVYLDSYTGATDETYGDGVERLHNVRDDPAEYDSTGSSADDDKAISITQDHEIFEGVGNVGDVVPMFDEVGGSLGYSAWFDEYSGEILADLNWNGEPTVAISDDGKEILWASGAETFFTWESDDDPLIDRTDEGAQLLINSVQYVQTGGVAVEGSMSIMTSETIQLDPGESELVGFDYTVTPADGTGEFDHVVASEDDENSIPVTVISPEQIDITDFDAPVEDIQGAEITVEATLEHTGTETTTQTLEYSFDEEVVASESVTMDPGDTQTVTFEYQIPEETEPGTYTHGVAVDFDEASTTIEVLEADPAFFEVSNLDAPGEAGQGDEITVTATITNTGELTGEQLVQYQFADDDPIPDPGVDEAHVAVVGDSDLADTLDDELDSDVYTVTYQSGGDDLLAAMDDYDVFVINDFDFSSWGDDGDVGDFLDALTDDQGAIYLDQWGSFTSNAISDVSDTRGDPASTDHLFGATSPVHFEITSDHAIFDGIASVGDEVEIADSNRVAWFNDYSGEILADIGDSSGLYGPAAGVNDENNEILLGMGRESFTPSDDDYTDDANAILANSVEYVAEQALKPTIELAPGESTTFEVTYEIDRNEQLGLHEHGVHSDNDSATANINIYEQNPDIVVNGWFPEPDPAEEQLFIGDTLTAEAVVANQGELSGEKEIKLFVGEEVVDSQLVELEAGEGTIIELEYTFSEADTKIMSVNGVDPIQFTVEDPDPADFQVTMDVDPDQLLWGEEIDVDATIHNAGEAKDTQEIELLIDGIVVDSETVTLRHDKTADVSFTYETVEDDVPEIEVEVASANDTASETVIVDAPAEFEVEITNYDDEVTAEETVTVEAVVENVGTLTDTQDIEFLVDGAVEDVEADQTLDGGQSATFTFTYETTRDDIGDLEVAVESEDDADTRTVTVNDVPAEFEVSITDIPDEVTAGEDVEVEATIENIGTASDTQSIEFYVDGELQGAQSVSLGGEQSTTVSFTYTTDGDDEPEIDVEVSSEDDSDSATVTVNPSGSSLSVAHPSALLAY